MNRSSLVVFILCLLGLFLAYACSPPAPNTPDGGDGDADADGDPDGGNDADEPDPVECDDADDCDDSIACTIDLCGVGNVCRNEPNDDLCPGEERCRAGRGCVEFECEENVECDDGEFCNGAERCSVGVCYPAAEPESCDDGNECTDDYCNVATDSCVNDPRPECTPDSGPDSGPDPFDPDVHYSGSFRVFGIPVSDCGAASFNISTLLFTSTVDNLNIQAGAFPMTQAPRPTGASFDVTYTQGGCGTYHLTGTFEDSNTFTGHWTATFSGGCGACDHQDADVTGVRS